MAVEPSFLIIGVQERPEVVLETLNAVSRLQRDLASLAGIASDRSKVLLCHSRVLTESAGLITIPAWDQVFEFCSREGFTLAMDPHGQVRSPNVAGLLSLALTSGEAFGQQVHLALSADSAVSPLSDLAGEWVARAVDGFLSNASLDLAVSREHNVLLIRSGSRLQLPPTQLDNRFENLVGSTRRFARMFNPSSVTDISFGASDPMGPSSTSSQHTAPPIRFEPSKPVPKRSKLKQWWQFWR